MMQVSASGAQEGTATAASDEIRGRDARKPHTHKKRELQNARAEIWRAPFHPVASVAPHLTIPISPPPGAAASRSPQTHTTPLPPQSLVRVRAKRAPAPQARTNPAPANPRRCSPFSPNGACSCCCRPGAARAGPSVGRSRLQRRHHHRLRRRRPAGRRQRLPNMDRQHPAEVCWGGVVEMGVGAEDLGVGNRTRGDRWDDRGGRWAARRGPPRGLLTRSHPRSPLQPPDTAIIHSDHPTNLAMAHSCCGPLLTSAPLPPHASVFRPSA